MPPRATSLVLFHCRFADHGLCAHHVHAFELTDYLALPHLYAVCAIDERPRPERMVGGLLLKSSLRYEDPAFLDGMAAAFRAVPALRDSVHEHTALWPAPVDLQSPRRPPTEDQALAVFRQLWSEHLAAQMATRFR